ncbi:hypothetical protein NBRC116494_33280 [Aurantivibrio plasticivorans]
MSIAMNRAVKAFLVTLLIIVLLIVAVLAAAPIIMQKVAVKVLQDSKLTQTTIQNVDLNIFAGYFRLQGFSAATEEQAHAGIGDLEIDFSLRPVFDNKVQIDNVSMDGLQVVAQQASDGSFSIGFERDGDGQDEPQQNEVPLDNEQAGESAFWEIGVGEIALNKLSVQVLSPDAAHSITLTTDVLVNELSINTEGRLTLGEVTFKHLLLKLDDREPLQWNALTINNIELTESFASVDSVLLEGLVGRVLRMDDQRLQVEHMLDYFVVPANDGGENLSENQPSSDLAEASASESIDWRVGEMRIDSSSRLNIEDESISPTLNRVIHFRAFHIGELASASADRKTPVNIDFTTDEHDEISVKGHVSPLASTMNAELALVVDQFSATDYSPYVEVSTGYAITSGVVNLDSTILIDNDVVNVSNALEIKRLQLHESEAAIANEFNAGMPMPINTALSVIRDSDDVISLSLPIDGTLQDPNFRVAPAIRSSLATALTKASLSYIKYAIQPWGAALLVGEQIVGAATKVSFDSVTYEPGSDELSSDMQSYLNTMSTLFKEKSALNVVACPVSTSADKQVLQNKAKNPLDEESLNSQLAELSNARYRAFKTYMVEQGGVQSSQIVECLPTFNDKENAIPAVNLNL